MAETNRIERLALINLAAHALSKDLADADFAELQGLIEALCRHHDASADACLTPERVAVLRQRTPTAFEAWQVRNA